MDSTRRLIHFSEIVVPFDLIASHSSCRFFRCTFMLQMSLYTANQSCCTGFRSGSYFKMGKFWPQRDAHRQQQCLIGCGIHVMIDWYYQAQSSAFISWLIEVEVDVVSCCYSPSASTQQKSYYRPNHWGHCFPFSDGCPISCKHIALLSCHWLIR